MVGQFNFGDFAHFYIGGNKAQDLLQGQVPLQGPECRLGALGWNPKTPVESGQELLQHGPGLFKGGCSREPEFRDQLVLEGSGRPLHPSLRLRGHGENQLYPQSLRCPSELSGRAGGLIFRLVLEDRVAVGVQGEGYAAAPEQALHQQEITAGILMIAEEGVEHAARGIVHREQYRELRSVLAQPPVVTAIHLDQHALQWHPLPAHPVLGRAPAPRTAQPSVAQDTPQGGPADVDAVALAQQLAEMGVVGPCVPGVSQVNHSDCNGLGSCVGRLAAPETVSNGGSAFLLVSRKDTPGVSRADTHECSRLIQRHVLSQQAVEDLESRLFFGRQSHIPDKLNVTFLLAS